MTAPFIDYRAPSLQELTALEAEIQVALKRRDPSALHVLGYGEITIAVGHPAERPVWACKRMPPSLDLRALQNFALHIDRYVEALRASGVHVIPTSVHLVAASQHRLALHIVQPVLPVRLLGPSVLRAQTPDPDNPFLNAIFDAMAGSISDRLGVDGQLANWVLINGRPWQIDVSTPFTRDEAGQFEIDAGLIASPYPGFFRPAFRTLIAPRVLARFHDLRATMLDFTGNLFKEGLSEWAPAAVKAANRRLDQPISVEEARAFYLEDARLWEWIYRLKVFSRRMTGLSGGVYQFLLPPPTDRKVAEARAG